MKDYVGPFKDSNCSSLVSDNQGMADISVFELDDHDSSSMVGNRCDFSLESVSFSASAVENKLNCLSHFKAHGPDNVHPFLLDFLSF